MNATQIEQAIAAFQDKELNTLWAEWKEMAFEHSNRPMIVLAGMVKSGKSTLANAIYGKRDHFASGVVRTTVKNEQVEFGNAILVDTPGVNANDEDTQEAENAYKHADMILFVHNLVDGELLRQEVEFIQKLETYFPEKDGFWQRVVFAFSNASQVDKEKLPVVHAMIQKQIVGLFGREIVSFTVDSLSFLKGQEENKQLLVQSSQVPNLVAYLRTAVERGMEQGGELTRERTAGKQEQMAERLQMFILKDEEKVEAVCSELNTLQERLQALESAKQIINGKKDEFSKWLANYAFPKLEVERVYLGGDYSSGYSYGSEYQAESAAEKHFISRFYEQAMPAFCQQRNRLCGQYQELIAYRTNANNPSYRVIAQAEESLNQTRERLTAILAQFEPFRLDDVAIDIKARPGEPDRWLMKTGPYLNDGRTGAFYEVDSSSWYLKANVDTDYMTTYKRGLFGEKEVEIYNYTFRDAVRDLESDLTSSLKAVNHEVYSECRNVFSQFCREVDKEVTAKWAELNNQLERNRAASESASIRLQKQAETQLKHLEETRLLQAAVLKL
ncbi:GTPase [Brevibacillus fulvus]|uniref:GTPase Era involved in 16S rRNA processing n=1 Tax=Brevibacillus fulvus TaxID=1125967 RepID=A0A938XSH9_9BACL|nr:GTPase [Brevibacillus fulvus]MBM7589132.1 GTPase Era involved in 16S rRNA processing [Brevibacillus fulvus]